MRSVNKVILLGNLGKDSETKFTPNGTACTKFSLATERRWKDKTTNEWKSETDWHNVILWRAEGVSNYLLKGKSVYVEGRIQTRSYEDKQGVKKYLTEIVADEVILLGDGHKSDSQPVSQPRPARQSPTQAAGGIDDDDVPFMRYDVPVI